MFKSILSVIKYFYFFNYAPSFEEIYQFLPEKTTKKGLKQELDYLLKKKIIRNLKLKIVNSDRYTLGEYSIKIQNSKFKIQNYHLKFKIAQKKLNNWHFKLYIKLLSLFPQIKLVGLSGSVAMMNAKEVDDIDLFIITAKNRLFTGRLIALLLAEILTIRRKFIDKSSTFHVSHFTNKVCLNLFFDEKDLSVPQFKRSLYVAHEVLQMKPIINKDRTYEKFLEANKWVKKFFPNIKINSKFETLNPKQIKNHNIRNSKRKSLENSNLENWNLFRISDLGFRIFDMIESLLRDFQIKLINRHRTTEIIILTQLWFHPDDFDKKLKTVNLN